MDNQISLFGSIRLTCEQCGARLEMASNYNEREVLNISIKKHHCLMEFPEVKYQIVLEEKDGAWFASRMVWGAYFGDSNWHTREQAKGEDAEQALFRLKMILG